MSEFRSAYSGHVRHTSLTGNGHEPEYEYKVTETGRELVKTGENDVYALIQSRLDETKIENIIKRATYDPTALGDQEWQNSEQMVDITDVPTDYHTWYNRIEDAKFLSTPSARRATAKTETKSLFSNKLYNILHEFRRALIYNGSKNYPNHAK